jgi:hypothetical protein
MLIVQSEKGGEKMDWGGRGTGLFEAAERNEEDG